MIQICPERDGRCPAGTACPYRKDRYSCHVGWSQAGKQIAIQRSFTAALGQSLRYDEEVPGDT